MAYYNLEKYSEAIADFNRVSDVSLDFRAYYNRGLAKFGLNKYLPAIADYNLALFEISKSNLDLSNQLSEIYNERGLTYFFLKDLDLALTDYSRAILTNTQSDRAYFNRGCAYQRQRSYLLASQDFTRAISINAHNLEALMNRAIAYRNLGKKSEAIFDSNTADREFLDRGLEEDYTYAIDLAKRLSDRDRSAIV